MPSPEARPQLLLAHSPAKLAIYDHDLRRLDASRSWQECFAGAADSLRASGSTSQDAAFAPLLTACEQALRGEPATSSVVCFEPPGGAPRWFSFVAHPCGEAGGANRGVCVYAAEETGQRALKIQQQRTESILHTAMDAILSIDEQHRIVLFNHAAETLFLCPAAEALGSPLERFLPAEFRGAHPRYVQNFGATGETTRSMSAPKRLQALRGDGQIFPIEATISKTGGEGERIYTVILRDITERQRTEAAMLRAEKLALAGRMAVSLAHEINNPLASLTNALYLVGQHEIPEEARHFLSLASSELQRVVHLTRQSLGFYQESGRPEPVLVPDLVESAICMMEGKIKRSGSSIERRWKTSRPVLGVAGELRQVVANLLANSLDAVSSGATVHFRSSAASMPDGRPAVRITISDDGHGISPAVRPHIFDPFYTTKGDFGTGLGLWVSKQLVDKQGGQLRLRSCNSGPRRGTAISLLLPAAIRPSAG